MDGFTGFKTPPPKCSPTVAVMDSSHVVRLVGDDLDKCRRRVQLAIHGHRLTEVMRARFADVGHRLTNVEDDLRLVKGHLIGRNSA